MSSSRRGPTALLAVGCAVVGLVAVVHGRGTPPAPTMPDPTAISRPIPSPLPGESATGGSPTAALSALGTGSAEPPADVSPVAGPGGIPGVVFAGYRHAESVLSVTAPRCHLEWSVLAALGRAVSGHARGGQVDARGRTVARLVGPRLSGSVGLRRLPDTDGGRWDGDATWDRAVGPMQIVPPVWRRYRAADDADPNQVGDAAVTAGRYLCAAGADLRQPTALRAAITRYSDSEPFVTSVLAAERDYRTATRPGPPPDPPSPTPVIPPGAPGTGPPTVRRPPAAWPNVVVPPSPGAEIVAGAPGDRVAARVGDTVGAPTSSSSGYRGGGTR